MKRILDDSERRLKSLYDKLARNALAPQVLSLLVELSQGMHKNRCPLFADCDCADSLYRQLSKPSKKPLPRKPHKRLLLLRSRTRGKGTIVVGPLV